MNLFDIFATLSLKADNFYQGLNQAKQSANSFSSSLASGLGKGLSNIGGAMETFGNNIAKIGKTASIVTVGVGTVLGTAFNKAKDYIATYESVMATFTHSAKIGAQGAQALYDSLLNVAKRSAFAREHLMNAGRSLVAMGFDAEKTTKYVQAVTDKIAQMGGSGTQIEEMAELFGKMSQQTTIYTQDINQMVTAGIPAWDILATKYHTTTDAVKDMAKKGLLPAAQSLDIITEALEESDEASEMFQFSVRGMAEELKTGTLTGTLDSLNTSFRTFALRLLDLDPATESGKENIKKLNAAISNFGSVIENLGTKLGQIFGKDLANLFNAVTNALERFNNKLNNMSPEKAEKLVHAIEAIAVAGPALLVVGKAISTIGGAIKDVGGLFEWFGKLFAADGAIGSGVSSFVSACGGVGAALGVVAAAVVAIIAVFIVLKDNWDNIVKAFSEWYEKSGMKENIEKLGSKLGELWKKFEKLHDLFTVLGTTILAVLAPTILELMGLWNGLVEALDGVITMVEGVVDVLAGIGEIIVGLFTFDGDKIQQGFSDLWEGIKEIFIGAFDAIWGFFDGFWNGISSAITSGLDNLGITEWFNMAISNIANFFLSAGEIIFNWFSELPGKISEWLANSWNLISTWFSELPGKILEWLANIGNIIGTWLSELPYKIGFALGAIIGTLINWGAEAINWVQTEVPNIINSIITFFAELPGRIATFFSETITNLINWGSDMANKGSETASNFLNNVINFIRELPGRIATFFSQTITNLIIWGSDMVSRGRQAASDLFNSIVDKIRELPGKMLEIGRNVVEGIANGIKNSIGWLKDQVSKFASGVMDGFKSAFGIHSPSTLFRDEVGKNIALGIGVGFEKEIDDVKKDMINSINDLTDIGAVDNISYSSSYNGKANAGLVNGLISAISADDNETTINLVVDGRVLAEVMYNPMSRLIQQKGAALNA